MEKINNIETAEKNNGNKLCADLDEILFSVYKLKNERKEIHEFCRIIASSYKGKNKIIFSGIGKNLLLGELISEFLLPYNISALILDPVRAIHGSMGIINKDDVLVISSKSGNTAELVNFMECLQKKVKIENKFLLTSNASSKLSSFNFKKVLIIKADKEVSKFKLSPQSTILNYFIVLLVLVNVIADRKDIKKGDYLLNHQGGEIGKIL